MPNKLRHKKPRVSFFAFQDMITTVTGVLLLVTLLLTIYLNDSTTGAEQSARDTAKDELEAARKELAAKLEALREKQVELFALTNHVFLIPEPDRSGKTPILIVLSATNGWFTRLGQTNATEFSLTAASAGAPLSPVGITNKFEDLLGQWQPAHDRLVFYVRPSSIANFEIFRALAQARGFNLGYDPAEEDKQYVLASP